MAGRDKLVAWLNERGTKQRWLAEKMGVPDPTISGWVTGRYSPSLGHAIRLEAATNGAVKVTDWGSANK